MNDQVNNGDQGQNTSLGWRAALPDEFKEHEFVKNFQKPGDFVKAAIEIKTERDSLKSRLEESIPRLPKDASPEEVEVFYRSIGMPENRIPMNYRPTVPTRRCSGGRRPHSTGRA